MKKIIRLSLILFCVSLNAQIGIEFNPSDLQSVNTYNSLNTKSGFIDIDDIIGSPYLDDNFKNGKIIETVNNQIVNTHLRYSIFQDKFEIRPNLNEDKTLALKRSSNYEFIYDGIKVNLVLNNKLFQEKDNGYVFLLLESENDGYNLYKRYTQNFTPPKEAKTSYDTDKPARLDTDIHYFISKNITKDFIELDDHRRRILDSFDSNLKSEMKDFMKSKNYKLRGVDAEIENQMIEIISHYNSLLNK